MAHAPAPEVWAHADVHVCPAPDSELVLAATDYVTRDVFRVVRCRHCGLARTAPVPPADEMDRYYPASYYGEGPRYGATAVRMLRTLLSRRARAVERFVGRPGRVLDIGCGQGLLLDAFRRNGWATLGTERSDAAAAYARTRLGLDVRVGDWREIDVPANAFDAVVVWHVLEHLVDPAAHLAWAATRLRPGGVLLVGVPNLASLEARLSGSEWFHLDVPRHLVHFTPDTLRRALERAGLEVVDWSSRAPEYDLVSVVQSALNRLGFGHNLLFMWLRRTSARPGSVDHPSVLRRVALWAAVPAVAILGAVWVSIAGAVGAGATMTVIARRREV